MANARFYREREQLALRLDEEIRASLSDDRIPPVTDALEEVLGEFSIGKYPESREMRFFLGDVAAFSPGLIARLHRLVANEFPKWAIVPQFEECTFEIKAGGVRFGDTLVRSPVTAETPALREWWDKARHKDEERYGSYRRQLSWLKSQVPAALKRLETARVELVGVFERLRFEGYAVWLLVRPNEIGSWHGVTLSPPESAFDHYPVDQAGRIHPSSEPRFDILNGQPPAAWLNAYLTRHPLPGDLVLLGPGGQPLGRVSAPAPIDDRTLTVDPAR